MASRKAEEQALHNETQQPMITPSAKTPHHSKPLGEQPRAVLRQECMVVLLSLGVLAFGMGLALPAVTLDQLTDPNEPVHLNKSQASWFASITTITCPLGSLLTAYLLDKIGRKRTFFVFNIIAISSWALMATAVQDDPETVFIQLIISRCLIGVAMGMGSSPPGVYAAEISLPKIRSRLILTSSLAVASGVLVVYILGYFIRGDWQLLAMILLGYQIICALLLIPIFETPSWLLSKGRSIEAKVSLYYFRGVTSGETQEEVEEEFDTLTKSIQSENEEGRVSFQKSIQLPEVYKPLLIMMGLFFCQQFSGIYVVVVYAVQIASEAGSSLDPMLCAVFIGFARVVTTFVLGIILEKWGRRQAAMISATGMTVSMLLLAYSRFLEVAFLPALLMVVYIVFSALGLWTLPFYIAAEVFPQKVRGACSGLIGFFAYMMSFSVLKAYPSMIDWMGYWNVLVFYGVISLLTVGYVYVVLPETKDKTLLEIEEYFRYGKSSYKQRKKEVGKEFFV